MSRLWSRERLTSLDSGIVHIGYDESMVVDTESYDPGDVIYSNNVIFLSSRDTISKSLVVLSSDSVSQNRYPIDS